MFEKIKRFLSNLLPFHHHSWWALLARNFQCSLTHSSFPTKFFKAHRLSSLIFFPLILQFLTWCNMASPETLDRAIYTWARLETCHALTVQWWTIENHQSPVYLVNCYFSWHPERCLIYCHNKALFPHKYHIWELSNEVLHDPLPEYVLKIRQVKVETSTLKSKYRPFYFWYPLRYRFI